MGARWLLLFAGLCATSAGAEEAEEDLPTAELKSYSAVFSANIDVGGYGAPVWGFSPTESGIVATSGGRGGAVFDEKFVFGGHGNTSVAVDGGRLSYGGLFVEWMPWGHARVHPDVDIAWGSGRWKSGDIKQPVQVIQGAMRAEVIVNGWFRVAAGPTVRTVMASGGPLDGSLQQTVGGELQARFGAW